MFPPIEDAILQNNPKFASLYKTLTTRILHPDGSTIQPAAPERDAKAEALKAQRLRSAKSDILQMTLSSLPLTNTTSTATKTKQPRDLPPDLIELILLLSLRLSTPTTPADLTILESTDLWASLPNHIPQISALISTHLHELALSFTRLLHPTANPSFQHRHIPKLPTTIITFQESITTKSSELAAARARLVPLTIQVLETYRAASALAIQHLEQTKHGALARHTKAKAEVVGLEAKKGELAAKEVLYRATGNMYTDEVKEALANYKEHLRVGRARLKEKKSDAEGELGRYGVGVGDGTKERTMKEVARVYGEMRRQIGEVMRDVERLQGT